MQHFLITLAFDGTRYHGFQVQKNAHTVCAELQNAMEKLFGTRPDVKGCSRTDSGVHAEGYCVSFFAPKEISARKLPLALNRHLPQDIRVLSAREVPQAFHARYSGVSKEYIYHIRNSAVASPFSAQYEWRYAPHLDETAMEQAAQLVVGTHDFSTFMSAGSSIEDAVRTVHFFHVRREGELLLCHICANGYLYNMVRILVGTLADVGAHRTQPTEMATILAAKNRAAAGDTAPAQGLFLYRVNYAEESFEHNA